MEAAGDAVFRLNGKGVILYASKRASELIASARDLYLSSVNNSLNKIMKTLTIVTVVTAVLNVMTGFFGMNFEFPFNLLSTRSFFVSVSLMVCAAITTITLFWWKKWL